MKRATYAQNGTPANVVTLEAVDLPQPGSGEVRLSIERAPINPSDLLQVQGLYGIRPPLPAVPGNEGIGRVTALGDGVTGVVVGQLVIAPAGGGTWQEQVIANAAGLVPLPEGDLDQLAMITVNPPTAFLLLDDFVDLQAGDWVIQNAANSAVGGYVVQLAAERGVRTINIVRREGAVAPLKALGADVVLVDGPDLGAQVRAAIGDGKLRLGLDAVGGPVFGVMADLLSPGGVMVSYGSMSGQPATLSAVATIFRDVTVKGFWLARWFERADQARKAEVFGNLIMRIAKGALSTKVEAVYPLEEITQALTHAAQGERTGKVLLAPAAKG
ncbi:zinc-dependent alcohol dehydrogenase family protein [Aliiroseovarius subalbicans]|uniref:zinc-dependent alcohol dehydrogenase family protein n=1 Tax=Aliiroseovarius subalbicans TaxID=2925840 RepID=UPI001F574252|nr:zinc-dependent alcohol dehydrogenase family protein [Aliiroseovarius subalbicans]MCI2400185.1 zinc-dependent alcohol dehydrogenase family protein [Aliiroseovarius subalbicans]